MAVLHTLTPDFDAFRVQFEQLADDADTLAGRLSDVQFSWRAEPTQWSVGECVEHLNSTARAYLPCLDESIAEAIRKGWYQPGPFRYGMFGRLAVRLMEPPPRMRWRSPRAFEPATPHTRQRTLAAFRAYQVQYVDRLRQADGLDLARTTTRSPQPYSWVRLSLGSAFHLMVAHQRRHLAQAASVVHHLSFPKL